MITLELQKIQLRVLLHPHAAITKGLECILLHYMCCKNPKLDIIGERK